VKQFLTVAFGFVFLVSAAEGQQGAHKPTVQVDSLFSPKGGITDAIVAGINTAKSSVLVEAYTFTSELVYNALIVARKRGVDVQVVIDSNWLKESSKAVNQLITYDVPVWSDNKHPIMHNKVVILDGATVITGSFNYTGQAENNAENIVIIRDVTTAIRFTDVWKIHQAHSTLVPPTPTPTPTP